VVPAIKVTEEAGRWEVGLASEPWGGWDSSEPEEVVAGSGGGGWWPWGGGSGQPQEGGSAVDVSRRASAVLDADRSMASQLDTVKVRYTHWVRAKAKAKAKAKVRA